MKTTGNHTGATYLEQRWVTNGSGNNSVGYKIDRVCLNCLTDPPTAANTTYVLQNWGYDGVLMDTDDVIYVWTNQPANHEMSIVLWPRSYADFDVYASASTSLPSPSNFQWSSTGGSNRSELIVIPSYPETRPIYIAIGSFSGEGAFRFYVNSHAPGYPQSIRVTTDWNPSETHKAIIRTLIKKMIQAVYYSTDGRHLIRYVDVYWNEGVSEPYINFSGLQSPNHCIGGQASWCSSGLGEHINLTSLNWCGNGCQPKLNPSCACVNTQAFNEGWAGNLAAHEVGHCYHGLPDEYSADYACGHSQMEDVIDTALNQVDYCTIVNGGKDVRPGKTGHYFAFNNWACVEYKYPSNPAYNTSHTPDAYFKTTNQAQGDAPFSQYIYIVEH